VVQFVDDMKRMAMVLGFGSWRLMGCWELLGLGGD
jgi:hypothetical protein